MATYRSITTRRRRCRSAAIVELVISLVVLLPILGWTIQMAWLYDICNSCSEISYVTARFAASHACDASTDATEADDDYNSGDSVLWAAYNACQNSKWVPYGSGAVSNEQGTGMTWKTVDTNGARIAISYKQGPNNKTSNSNYTTPSTRMAGDWVKVSVKYDLSNNFFLPAWFPGMPSDSLGGHTTNKVSWICVTQS